jgi:hypothetical protein
MDALPLAAAGTMAEILKSSSGPRPARRSWESSHARGWITVAHAPGKLRSFNFGTDHGGPVRVAGWRKPPGE